MNTSAKKLQFFKLCFNKLLWTAEMAFKLKHIKKISLHAIPQSIKEKYPQEILQFPNINANSGINPLI